MTVCELMKVLKEHDGQIVTVQGDLRALGRRMQFDQLHPMPHEFCSAPGYSEPARILIRWPDEEFLSNPPDGYELDKDSLSDGMRKIEEGRQNPGIASFIVVVRGLLSVTQNGPAVPPNVDRHGWYPARLVIQAYNSIQQR
jgi:hypothetical protein